MNYKHPIFYLEALINAFSSIFTYSNYTIYNIQVLLSLKKTDTKGIFVEMGVVYIFSAHGDCKGKVYLFKF